MKRRDFMLATAGAAAVCAIPAMGKEPESKGRELAEHLRYTFGLLGKKVNRGDPARNIRIEAEVAASDCKASVHVALLSNRGASITFRRHDSAVLMTWNVEPGQRPGDGGRMRYWDKDTPALGVRADHYDEFYKALREAPNPSV